MKHLFKLSLLSLISCLIQVGIIGQNIDVSGTLKPSKELLEKVNKILSNLPENSSDRNIDLIPNPDTVIYSYNGIVEELITFTYAEINGEILPVSSIYIYVPDNEVNSVSFEYDNENRIIRLSGTVVLEENTQEIAVSFVYDEFGIRISQTILTSVGGLPVEFVERVQITRDVNGNPVDLIKEQGVLVFGFGEIERLMRISNIAYQNNVPVNFTSSSYFYNESEELDSITTRFSDVRWFRYENQLINIISGDDNLIEINISDFIPFPTREHVEQVISGTSEAWDNGEWLPYEVITLNHLTNNIIDISIEGFLNRREVYSMDENELLLQKDIYYEFNSGEVSEREIYTYTDFQREASYERFQLINNELVSDLFRENEYTFDGNERLILLTEKSSAEENRTTEFRYTGSTSAKETVEIAKNVRVFPNPVINTLNIKSEEFDFSGVNYSIYDSTGRIVQSSVKSINHSQIDVSGLGAGMYILLLKNEQQIATVKFAKL